MTSGITGQREPVKKFYVHPASDELLDFSTGCWAGSPFKKRDKHAGRLETIVFYCLLLEPVPLFNRLLTIPCVMQE